MIICPNCKTINPDNAKFCQQCGKPLAVAPIAPSERDVQLSSGSQQSGQTPAASSPQLGKKRTDILFVVDCTFSMAGEIEAIKNTIIEFKINSQLPP